MHCIVPGKSWPLAKLAYSLKDPETGEKTVGGFFPMSPVNRALVRRSWGLLEQKSSKSKGWSLFPSYFPPVNAVCL